MRHILDIEVCLVGLIVLASCSGGGTATWRGSGDAAIGPDTSPAIRDASDAGGRIVLPSSSPACSDATTSQAVARVTAALPCFSGTVVNCPGSTAVCARFAFGSDSSNIYQFYPCDGSSVDRVAPLTETATAALQGIEATQCSLYVRITNPDFMRLKDTIVRCEGPVDSITFDSNGAVAEVHATPPDSYESEVLSCIRAAEPDWTSPCLANVSLCPEVALANRTPRLR